MHVTSLSPLEEITITIKTLSLSVYLALYYSYVQGTTKLGPVRKASLTERTVNPPEAAVDAMFS